MYEVLGSSVPFSGPESEWSALYRSLAPAAGIVAHVAYAQALHETGNFTFPGTARAEWNNPAGLGVTGSPDVGNRFPTKEAGVRAHLGHLLWYVGPTHPVQGFCDADQRHFGAHKGLANDIRSLNGKWAVPGTTYGQAIWNIAETLRGTAMYDVYTASPNYSVGRAGHAVRYIVVHTTEGTGQGAVNWFQNLASQVSAHYVIMEDGTIVQMVSEADEAWHAGIIVGTPTTVLYDGVNPNYESIGIEYAGYAAAPLGPQQISAGTALIKDIRNRHGNLPIVGHVELSPGNRSDPGQYNLAWIKREVEDTVMTSDEIWAAIAPYVQAKVVAPQADTNTAIKNELARIGGKVDAIPVGAGHTHTVSATTSVAK